MRKKKVLTVMSQIISDFFFFKMSSDAPVFKVPVVASDFKLGIKVYMNEYYE